MRKFAQPRQTTALLVATVVAVVAVAVPTLLGHWQALVGAPLLPAAQAQLVEGFKLHPPTCRLLSFVPVSRRCERMLPRYETGAGRGGGARVLWGDRFGLRCTGASPV